MRKIIVLIGFVLIAFHAKSQGLSFDGINDYLISAQKGPSGTSDRTVECWIKTNNSISTQQVLIDWGAMSPNGSRFTLNLIGNGRLRIEVGGNGITGTTQIANGMWHHVAVTYEHLATTKVKLYIDGVQELAGNFTVSVNTDTTNAIQLGRRNDGVNYYQGEMDEVRIWNVTRTATQILADMNIEFCSPQNGLVTYYQLNDGIPNGANSSVTKATESVTSNSGNLTNFTLSGTSSNWVNGATGLTTTLNDSITQIGSTIVAIDSTADTYRWIDCNSATNLTANRGRTYVPIVNGDYQVVLQKGTCIDSSACLSFLSVGITEASEKVELKGFPNPTKASHVIQIPKQLQQLSGEVNLYSSNGTLVLQKQVNSFPNKLTLNFNELGSGLYYVQVVNEKYTLIEKVVVEK